MTQKSLTFDECKQLSSRIIAMNPNRRANMGQISSHLLDYYTELTKQPWLAQLVGQIRDLTTQQNQMMQQEEMKAGETYQQLDRKISDLKKQLPFRSPHYFHFLEDHRAQKFIDPEASVLIVGVGDRENKDENGELRTMPGVKRLIRYQQALAAETGVAFWNMFEAMGGEGSMVEMVNHKPQMANYDYTHINFRGGKHIAGLLFETLMYGKEQYEKRKAYEME